MIYFACDYQEGCAPEILKRLAQTNMEQTVGYGLDPYSLQAKRQIAVLCGLQRQKDAAPLWREAETAGTVHFLVGGTQTNDIVIRALLRPHQGVIAAQSGHVNVHETGAIEHSGHKVIALSSYDGKLTAAQIQNAILHHLYDPNIEHCVQPGMVYLSFPTETGLLYTKNELETISTICRQYSLPLYIDGARLGYGLSSPACDLTLQDIARLTDLFYIGGTKQGALFGEALVITNPLYRRDFRYLIKQGGAMLAKGRLLGLQFLTLFGKNKLYQRLSSHAIGQAMRIREALLDKHYELAYDSYTNQQFALMTPEQYEALSKDFVLDEGEHTPDGRLIVRICTCWATREENVTKLIDAL